MLCYPKYLNYYVKKPHDYKKGKQTEETHSEPGEKIGFLEERNLTVHVWLPLGQKKIQINQTHLTGEAQIFKYMMA